MVYHWKTVEAVLGSRTNHLKFGEGFGSVVNFTQFSKEVHVKESLTRFQKLMLAPLIEVKCKKGSKSPIVLKFGLSQKLLFSGGEFGL